MTERDFLQTIKDDPDEISNYLVYADWLEDQGEEDRAAFVRVSVEYEKVGRNSPRRDELWKQFEAQRDKVNKSWTVLRKWERHFSLGWRLGIPNRLKYREWPSLRSLRALPELPSITTLEVGTVPAPEFFEALRERSDVRHLELSNRAPDFDALARLTDLEGIAFDYHPITEANLARLLPLQKLRSLNLFDSPIGDTGAAWLPSFPLLEELDLSMTGITDAALEHIVPLKHLERLSIYGNPITDAALQRLAGLKRLTQLNVGDTEITKASLDLLLTFKKLRNLGLERLGWVDDSNFPSFSLLRDLRAVDLSRTGVTRYNLRRTLKRFGKLKHVKMEGSLDESDSPEVHAFQKDMDESEYFVEMDFE